MYRHLLVPIDDSDLSVEVVGNAVGLARALGARVSFFHARADHDASLRGEADALRLAAPRLHEVGIVHRAQELLAKAAAAAHACGVPCDTVQAVSDRPAEAIVAAARERGCDLIFMASHGARSALGMALGSATLQVLRQAGLPVLVAAAADPAPPSRAIGIIRDEHRALAAVLHAAQRLLAEARARGEPPAAGPLRTIVRYLHEFPLALHHPKEDRLLFAKLRERTGAYDAELDELARQHERDHALVAGLARDVEHLAAAAPSERAAAASALDAALSAYTAFVWEHLGREEAVILPAAQRHLGADDWAELDAAFAANPTPRAAGTALEIRELFARIVAPTGAAG